MSAASTPQIRLEEEEEEFFGESNIVTKRVVLTGVEGLCMMESSR